MSDEQTNGSAAGEEVDSRRPYVVLEQVNVSAFVTELLKNAAVELDAQESARLAGLVKDHLPVYTEVARPRSRNANHALIQVGRQRTSEGTTPPMVAVSERMFQPHEVEVSFDPKVSVS